MQIMTRNTLKLNAFPILFDEWLLLKQGRRSASKQTISNTPIQYARNVLKSRNQIPTNFSRKQCKIFLFQLLQINRNFQISILNLFQWWDLKLLMHQCECEERNHTINKQIITPNPIKCLWKQSFSNSKCNYSKMNFFFKLWKWNKREKIQLSIFLFKVNKASKQTKHAEVDL